MSTSPVGSPTSAPATAPAARSAAKPTGKPRTGKKSTSKKNAAVKELSEVQKTQRKLFIRMGMAISLMLALLLALFVFDFLKTDKQAKQDDAPPSVVATAASEKKVVPTESPPELPPAITISPTPLVEAEKAVQSLSQPAAQPAVQPIPPAPVVAPENTAVAPNKASAVSQPPPPEVVAHPVLPRPEKTGAPVVPSAPTKVTVGNPESNTARLQARVVEPAKTVFTPTNTPAPSTPSAPLAPARLMSGYAVQAGVFSDVHRAEELHAKLVLAGIPATLETRVQIGPFKTRAEADAARTRLEKMGVTAVLLPKAEKSRARK